MGTIPSSSERCIRLVCLVSSQKKSTAGIHATKCSGVVLLAQIQLPTQNSRMQIWTCQPVAYRHLGMSILSTNKRPRKRRVHQWLGSFWNVNPLNEWALEG